MLSTHVHQNQIEALLQLKSNTVIKINKAQEKRDFTNNIKKEKRIKRTYKPSFYNDEVKNNNEINIRAVIKKKSIFLPKESVVFPKRSHHRKPSKSISVYGEIAKFGVGKLIYINSN
ncbi:hypothetical protein [Hwangdonia sp.]|uniref:hypothetical protein n=1 Tax=Hwangdonia sp. TaxID=1883432 RepID=UPI003AB280B5